MKALAGRLRPNVILCVAAAILGSACAGRCNLAKGGKPPRRGMRRLRLGCTPIVAGMTLEQKIGQMTQPDIRSVTPDDVRRYYIGSILNGGGAWPSMNMHSSVGDWLKLSDAFYRASMSTDMKVKIPVIWGTDAVHGHNNVYGATLFPHNIGLGAAHDPALMERIGRATAEQVRATGITWAFAPTLAVVQNPALGPDLRKLQLRSGAGAVLTAKRWCVVFRGSSAAPTSVLATAKHWLGDGGTFHGKDQGETRTSEANLAATHAAGYYGALKANVQTVMVSYSSFTDTATGKRWGKMHGNAHLVGDVLKRRLGFDGLVVSDWNGIEQVPGCTKWHCPQAINAGIDLVMVPDDWKKFIPATIAGRTCRTNPDEPDRRRRDPDYPGQSEVRPVRCVARRPVRIRMRRSCIRRKFASLPAKRFASRSFY